MSQEELSKTFDALFLQCVGYTQTPVEHHAAIDVWNELVDGAIAHANKMKDRYLQEKRYEHAVIARDMIEFFRTMKATHDAPFREAT